MGLHDGHRQRLIQRFLEQGLDGFASHQVLELLLFYSIPRKDTNELAHELIRKFGSLSGVFDAPYEQLLEVPGVGENTASLLKLIPDLTRRYMQTSGKGVMVNDEVSASRLLHPWFLGTREELVYAILLDGKCKCLAVEKICGGGIASVDVHVRRLVSLALQFEAVGVILGHNHPGGVALPSQADIMATQRIEMVLKGVGLQLVDHLIFTEQDYVSLKLSGAF